MFKSLTHLPAIHRRKEHVCREGAKERLGKTRCGGESLMTLDFQQQVSRCRLYLLRPNFLSSPKRRKRRGRRNRRQGEEKRKWISHQASVRNICIEGRHHA
jgi:hypothetical protein